MNSQIVLEITLKDGSKLSGTYTIYEALAHLRVAAGRGDFEDFRFGEAE